MTPAEYLSASSRTAAKECFPGRVCETAFYSFVEDFIKSADDLDQIKKGLFYNKDVGLDWGRGATQVFTREQRDVVHALLGIATESGELLELIGTQERGKLIDEAGDVLWYLAMLFRALGTNFEEVMERNIKKLPVRYPEKFTTEHASIRDLTAENVIFRDL